MHNGFCKWFDDARGFGFLRYIGGDVFVHYSAIQSQGHRTLVKDEEVTFDIITRDDGRQAAANVWRDPSMETAQ